MSVAQSPLKCVNNVPPPDNPPGEKLWAKKLHFAAGAAGTTGFWFVAIVGGSIIFSILWFFQAIAVYIFKVCLRRVSPVESKKYALLRNGVSLLAIAAVLVRAFTLLNEAQAETFQTQSRVADCHAEWLKLQIRNIQIVVHHEISSGNSSMPPSQNYTFEIRATHTTFGTVPCSSQMLGVYSPYSDITWFEQFNCSETLSDELKEIPIQQVALEFKLNNFVGETPPQVWLFNSNEDTLSTNIGSLQSKEYTICDRGLRYDIQFEAPKPRPVSPHTPPLEASRILHALTPWIVPSWQLRMGWHVRMEASLVKRKFITSSFMKDTVWGFSPVYQNVTIFPTNTILSENLGLDANGSATGILTFAVRPTFDSFVSYKQVHEARGWGDPMPPTCMVVEDYRSSTAFDALGSIGGLFAIVQGLHILLFGRPLFWGLLGTKLISPFGLLGGLSTKGFRQRLKEHYSLPEQPIQSHNNIRSTMRIDAFLRDFVIDFGPVDFEPEKDLEKGEETSTGLN
ncbi:hypothetical protein BDV93DRAFT_554059 [Ceratobasidium sp. AG-I]|nr:hypothetical protein BDV93DRAFT_554059 [Ceratobasidium sp. AG-I]